MGKRYDQALKKIEGQTIRKDSGETNKRSKFLFLETGKRKVCFLLFLLLSPNQLTSPPLDGRDLHA